MLVGTYQYKKYLFFKVIHISNFSCSFKSTYLRTKLFIHLKTGQV